MKNQKKKYLNEKKNDNLAYNFAAFFEFFA